MFIFDDAGIISSSVSVEEVRLGMLMIERRISGN
jgi:hypothetical protein